jgi:hypothetical protein
MGDGFARDGMLYQHLTIPPVILQIPVTPGSVRSHSEP